jgi:hypothetical protein
MFRIMRVADLIQKYFPSENILYQVPNFKYSNHYIFHDNFMGIVVSTHTDNYKKNYTHIDEHKREDIIAMNVHQNFMNGRSEKDVATNLQELINNIHQYSHN